MKAYGYIKKKINDDGLLELKEVAIQTAPKHLRAIAAFMIKAANEIEAKGNTFDHIHLQNSWDGWCDKYPDIIISKK